MESLIKFAEFDLGDAGFEVAPPFKAAPGTLGKGSRNLIGFGRKNRRPFRGLELQSGKLGVRIATTAAGKLAGLADIGSSRADGSIDSYLRNTLWFIGFGQVVFDGLIIPGAVAKKKDRIRR